MIFADKSFAGGDRFRCNSSAAPSAIMSHCSASIDARAPQEYTCHIPSERGA